MVHLDIVAYLCQPSLPFVTEQGGHTAAHLLVLFNHRTMHSDGTGPPIFELSVATSQGITTAKGPPYPVARNPEETPSVNSRKLLSQRYLLSS